MIRIPPRTIQLLVLLLLAAIGHALYVIYIPPWQAPDEPAHFEVGRLIRQNNRWVTDADRGPRLDPPIMASLERNKFFRYLPWATRDRLNMGSEAYQPQLYYQMAAWSLYLTPNRSIETKLYVMRFVSVGLNLSLVVVAFLVALQLFPQDRFLQWTIPAFVGLQPMVTFISSSVNNDNLAILVSSLAILCLVRFLTHRNRLLATIAFLALIPIAYLSKRTALVMVPIGLIAYGLDFLANRRRQLLTLRRRYVVSLAMVAGILLTLKADLIVAQIRSLYVSIAFTSSLPALPEMMRVLTVKGATYGGVLFTSFWGLFGWLVVPLPDIVYWILGALCGFAVLGFVHYYWKSIRLHEPQVLVIATFAVAIAAYLASILLVFSLYEVDPTFVGNAKGSLPQARYLFPAIIPIATLLMLGVRELIPQRLRNLGAILVISALCILDLGALFLVIVPYYRSF